MKKLLLSMLLFVFVQMFTFAQNDQSLIARKVREIGVSFSNFNNFGLRYKTGGSKAIFRFTLLSFNGAKSKVNPDTLSSVQNNFGAGFKIGIEKRKAVTEKLIFYHGLDLISSYNKYNYKNNVSNLVNNSWTTSTGIGVVIGFNYNINSNFLIAAEAVPSITYNYGKTHSDTNGKGSSYATSGVSYGLSNLGINLTLAYRFGK